MVSDKTVTDVYMVLQAHLNVNQRTRILRELAKVKGNKSFTQSVKALCQLHGRLLKTMRVDEALDKNIAKEEVVLESEDGANDIQPTEEAKRRYGRKSDEGHDGYTG
jgi:hypothetical protein